MRWVYNIYGRGCSPTFTVLHSPNSLSFIVARPVLSYCEFSPYRCILSPQPQPGLYLPDRINNHKNGSTQTHMPRLDEVHTLHILTPPLHRTLYRSLLSQNLARQETT
jgi:hypothetical protein